MSNYLPERTENQAPPPNPIQRDDTQFAAGKIAFYQYLSVIVFLFLISGFWDLQVRNPGFYDEAAERNRIKSVPMLAPRGKILDRDGRVIVDNHTSHSLILSRENLKPEHIPYIAAGLNIDRADLEARLRRFRWRPKYEPVVIKEQLTPAELSFVEAHRDPATFPEMELIPAQRRLYPQNGFAAHLIGYVGEVSENELDLPEYIKYEQGDVIGKYGIEKQYNDTLMGVDGQRQVAVDNYGRQREIIGNKDAIPGKDLQLSIDLDLQTVAELSMDNRNGAVVALDPRNGELLAMVSRPAYDPNKFAGRIRTADWNEILKNPENPMLNRALQGQQAPGSTFKPIMALAGLEEHAIDDNFRAFCPGGASFYGRFFKCHLKGGHGTVDLHKGMAQSCDVFFYNVGNRLGVDKIAKYATMAGLGRKTGIDLPHETAGTVPSEAWNMKMFRRKWYAGETISVSIGQGAVTVSPLQLAHAIAGIAMGGVWYRPHVVRDPKNPVKPQVENINPENAQKIISGMYAVVNEGGTGVRARLSGLSVCGKTGTAQLASNEMLKGTALGRTMKDNAWFVGFAPCEAPEIVVVALFEHGEHGNLAAPIVRDVIKAYWDKKLRQQQSAAMLARVQPPQIMPAPVMPPLQQSRQDGPPANAGSAPQAVAEDRPPTGTEKR